MVLYVVVFVHEKASVCTCMCTAEINGGSGGRTQVYTCVIRLSRALGPAAGWRRGRKGWREGYIVLEEVLGEG